MTSSSCIRLILTSVFFSCVNLPHTLYNIICTVINMYSVKGYVSIIDLDDGKVYRKPLYLMVKTMVSCRFSLTPIHWIKLKPKLGFYPNILGVWSPSAPPGEYHFNSSRLGRRDGPAGRNTTASVKAEFHGGTVNISHSAELGTLLVTGTGLL